MCNLNSLNSYSLRPTETASVCSTHGPRYMQTCTLYLVQSKLNTCDIPAYRWINKRRQIGQMCWASAWIHWRRPAQEYRWQRIHSAGDATTCDYFFFCAPRLKPRQWAIRMRIKNMTQLLCILASDAYSTFPFLVFARLSARVAGNICISNWPENNNYICFSAQYSRAQKVTRIFPHGCNTTPIYSLLFLRGYFMNYNICD